MMKDYLRETPCIPGRESFLLGTRNGVGAVNRIDKAENLGRLFVLVPRRARFESQFSRQIALATNFYCHRRDISAGFPRQPEKRTGREKDLSRVSDESPLDRSTRLSPLLPYNIKNLYMEVLNRYNRYKLFIPKMSRTRRSYYRSIRRYFVQRYFISFYTY